MKIRKETLIRWLLKNGWEIVDSWKRGFPDKLSCPNCGSLMEKRRESERVKYYCPNLKCRIFTVYLRRVTLERGHSVTLRKITYAQVPYLEARVNGD